MKNSIEYLLKQSAFSSKEKVVRAGRVAVMISDNQIGWYTRGRDYKRELLFDPKIVQFYEDRDMPRLIEYVRTTYPGVHVDASTDLQLRWLPEGTLFRVQQEISKYTAFDKAESIEIFEEFEWIAA